MPLRFTKMHGLGNDFVVIDAVRQVVELSPEQVRAIADRHFGVGCDQLLIVERPQGAGVDFRYRIFNSDGAEVEQCGNGARCFVRFVHDKGLTAQRELRVETRGGCLTLQLGDDGNATVNMGVPLLEPGRIPFDSASDAVVQPLELADGTRLAITAVSMGNPHAVHVVADTARAEVARIGPMIEAHPRFPARVNAGFMQVVDERRIRLRVYERGAGETLACGSGACAAVVAGILRGLVLSPVVVETRGGELTIAWSGRGEPVWMSGPATTVFEGELDLAALGARPDSGQGEPG